MSLIRNHVVLGGGQDANNVTTTDHQAGKYEAKYYDKILQQEIGGVKRALNALAFNPDVSQDGYIRLHHFDHDYFHIKISVAQELVFP